MRHRSRHYRGQKRKLMLILYVAFLALLSASVLLMPFGAKTADRSMALTYLSGVMFWTGLIGTITEAARITHSRRRSHGFAKTHSKHKRLGPIRFFQNVPATVCDVLMLVSLIGLLIAYIWAGTTVWPFISLSVLIFSFGMHCMLNGSNYVYINYKIRRVIE